jgi:hypothetical protein
VSRGVDPYNTEIKALYTQASRVASVGNDHLLSSLPVLYFLALFLKAMCFGDLCTYKPYMAFTEFMSIRNINQVG